MNEQELKEIEDRCNAAIPGPWRFNLADEVNRPSSVSLHGPEQLIYHTRFDVEIAETAYDHNMTAIFISNARTDIPKLIAEIRKLQAQNTRLRQINYEWVQAGQNPQQIYGTQNG